jgi:GT2 family glycosyltransferase
MDLAIIIVSYNVRPLLQDCLASLWDSLGRSPQLTAELLVVDNASSDGSPEMVEAQFPRVQLFPLAQNLGFAAGNNLALQMLGFKPLAGEATRSARALVHRSLPKGWSSPRHILLLNPDTIVHGTAVAQMIEYLDSHPGAGGCGPQLAYPDGRFQQGAFHFPGLVQIALDFFPPPGGLSQPVLESRLNGRYPRRRYAQGIPFPVDFVLGAALLVRAEVIRQVGLLDEGYFMYCEEMDWQRRLAAVGWQIVCVPGARVTHVGGASTSQFRGPMFVSLWRSRLRYFQRYHNSLFNWLAIRLIGIGMEAVARRDRRHRPDDLSERLAAYEEVRQLAAGAGS